MRRARLHLRHERRRAGWLRPLAPIATLMLVVAGCGSSSQCAPGPGCVRSIGLEVTASNQFPKPATNVTFTAKASYLHDCRADYAWNFDGDGVFDDATGSTVTRSFSSVGHLIAAARVEDCAGAASSGTNVWVQATAPLGCPPNRRPFDLIWSGSDAN
jgi:hypothetical protein